MRVLIVDRFRGAYSDLTTLPPAENRFDWAFVVREKALVIVCQDTHDSLSWRFVDTMEKTGAMKEES